MKYGESTFDILYLVFVITNGIIILKKAGSKREKYMGLAALILGCGDAFHLVRVCSTISLMQTLR